MEKTVTIKVYGSARDVVQTLARSLTDAFGERVSVGREESDSKEQKDYGFWPATPDDEAAVLWYALEIEKAGRAYDEHMKELCMAASQAKSPDAFCKAMEGHTDKYTFFGQWLHQAIVRGHYPWISVNDMKPDDADLDWVQVQTLLLPECSWGVPETAEMRDGKWYTIDDTPLEENERVIVTHWRPLPAPPKGKIP